jgi:putative glutamine amidotransferase
MPATPARPDRPRIGLSACYFHPDPQRRAAPTKTLQWIEQSTAHWIMAGGALPVVVPAPQGDTYRGDVAAEDYAHWLDGLVLHGGADLWPGSYGEEPLQPQWAGDRLRDQYELALVRAFVAAGKPVFGICRGLQLLNVAHGGTLWQDLPTQRPGAAHRDPARYDLHLHEVRVLPGSRLAQLLGAGTHRVNSIHHQGIKDLAPDFVVEAVAEDGLPEAIRHAGDAWVAGVQWHPELHAAPLGTVDDLPVLHDFLAAARAARR